MRHLVHRTETELSIYKEMTLINSASNVTCFIFYIHNFHTVLYVAHLIRTVSVDIDVILSHSVFDLF